MNILFVCSRNQWRSRTAEIIFRNHPTHQVRSAGTARNARVKVSEKLIEWAEVIFVMEKKHRQQIVQQYGHLSPQSRIIILDIPDEYQLMDEELIMLLRISTEPYLSDEV